MPDHSRNTNAPCVRIPAETVGDRPGRCPTHRRTLVDHAVEHPGRHRPDPLCSDPLLALSAALDLVELHGRTVEEACAHLPRPGERAREHPGGRLAPLHEGLRTWVGHAARVWLRALDQAPGPVRTPHAQPWLRRFGPRGRSRNARTYEVLAPGRVYTFPEGRDLVRELRVPVVGALAGGGPGPAEAVAAHVLASGAPVDRAAVEARPWRHRAGEPLPTREGEPPPDRVRLVQVSCLDGAERVLFEGSPEEAARWYAAQGRPALRALVSPTGPRSPGPDCAPCKLRRGCDRPAHLPGFLGFRDRSRPRRTWSVQDGVRHRACPASAHLHEIGLPGASPGPQARLRAHLADMHARSPRRGCAVEDTAALPGAEQPRTAALAAAHAPACALHDLPDTAPVHAGLRLPLQDPLADVLVLARIDLLYGDRGAWIQRQAVAVETHPEPDGPGLLNAHPDLAVSVLLFASGAVVPGPGSRVELETVTPHGARVHALDPFCPGLRSRARDVVSELASPWHQDTSRAPAPGPACTGCDHRRWCPENPDP